MTFPRLLGTHHHEGDAILDMSHHSLVDLTTFDDHTQYTRKDTLTTTGDLYYASGAATPARLALSVPAANVRNVLGVDNGDTVPAWKTALDATAPTTIAAGAAAAAGTSLIFSHRDHTHGAPSTYPATPHALLDGSVNNDTAAHAPVRGDLIVANSTPAWTGLAVGSNGSVLWSNGTDPSWTGSPLLSGYLRVGSTSAPSNTTAGDLTVVRMMLGTDAAFGSTFNNAVMVVNRSVTPANATQRQVYVKAQYTPDGTNSSSRGGLEVVTDIVPSASDAGVHRGGIFTVQHTSGAFDLTASGSAGTAQIGLLMTTTQSVGSTTIGRMTAGVMSMTVSNGTVTLQQGLETLLTGSGGTAITTMNHYSISISSLPTAITTHRGLNIPNLGGAAVTTAVGVDIAAQSGATNNFDIRAAGQVVVGGYLRVGSTSAPTNTTAGDVTLSRLIVTNASITNSAIVNITGGNVTPTTTKFNTYIQQVYTPNGGNVGLAEAVRVEAYSRPTAADTGTVYAIDAFVTHDSGAFNPGSLIGMQFVAKQQVGSTTAANVIPLLTQAQVSAGDATNVEVSRAETSLTGGGTVTTCIVYNILMNGFPTAITTFKGLNIPNMGNAAVTTLVAIDVAQQTGATTNIGLRNAATTVMTPSASQDLVAATAILANATTIKITASGGSIVSTAAPTIADGQDGQIIVVVNVDAANSVTLQDQGTLASSNLRLSANTIALGPRDNITLLFSAAVGDWIQIGQVNVL